MVERDGPIGAQSVRAGRFASYRTVDTGSWLGRRFQGRGLGKEMRAAVLGFAFDGLWRQVAETSAFLDNGARTACRGARLRGERVRQPGAGGRRPGHPEVPDDRGGWRSRPPSQLAIEGLDGIRDLFGA
jgi:hypothetical protein